jgi:hypothetical protein
MNWEKIGERRGISHRNTWKQTSDRIVNLYYYNNPDQLLLPTNTKMEVFPSEQ